MRSSKRCAARLLQLARTTAAQVDGDLHRTIISPSQEGSEAHERALLPLVRMHRAAHDVCVRLHRHLCATTTSTGCSIPRFTTACRASTAPPDPIMTEYEGHDQELRARLREEQIADVESEASNRRPRLPERVRAGARPRGQRGRDARQSTWCWTRSMRAWRCCAARSPRRWSSCCCCRSSPAPLRIVLRQFAADIVSKLREARADAERERRGRGSRDAREGAFLAMMSHEIRTPMNGMLGVADLLRTMSPNPAQKKLLDILAEQRTVPAADHQRHPGFLEDRCGAARAAPAAVRAARPARGARAPAASCRRATRTSPSSSMRTPNYPRPWMAIGSGSRRCCSISAPMPSSSPITARCAWTCGCAASRPARRASSSRCATRASA